MKLLTFLEVKNIYRQEKGNLTAQSTRSHRGLGIPETWLQALFPFPAPPPERPGELARKLSHKRVGLVIWRSRSSPALTTHWICSYYPVPGSEIVGSVDINWKILEHENKTGETLFFLPPSSFLRSRAHIFVCLSLTSSLLPESLEQANIILKSFLTCYIPRLVWQFVKELVEQSDTVTAQFHHVRNFIWQRFVKGQNKF